MSGFSKTTLLRLLESKAPQSNSKFYIAAAAFSKKNNLLGIVTNKQNDKLPYSKRGTGFHAEESLFKKYGRKIDHIYIVRVGRSGDPLPIDPCPKCAKIARKFGVEIINLHKENDILPAEVFTGYNHRNHE
jgi:hypothetical protein